MSAVDATEGGSGGIEVSYSTIASSRTTATLSITSSSSSEALDCFVHVHEKGKHTVRCKICGTYPEIVKRYFSNNKLPSITLQCGTKYLKRVTEEHLKSKYHLECVKTHKMSQLEFSPTQNSTIDSIISRANKSKADYIGKLMLSVYNDAKRLNLSAWSWPSRFVSFESGNAFDSDAQTETTVPPQLSLQYINPPSHLKMLSTIVRSDEKKLIKKIQDCRALSLRVDGSIDRTQIDKIYVIAKITTAEGIMEQIFLGVAGQKKSGASGLFEAVMSAIDDNLGEGFHEFVFASMSSICTDGHNVNTGSRHSLWKFVEDKAKECGSTKTIIKIWCASHRSDLSWKDFVRSFTQIKKTLSTLSSISSYFNQSATKQTAVKDMAEKKGLKLLKFPKLFEIRWTEYTYKLVRNVLMLWHILVQFFTAADPKDKQAKGFLVFILRYRNLKLMTFMADLLQMYQRFQKKTQSSDLHLVSLHDSVNELIDAIDRLKISPTPGGYEDELEKTVITNEMGEKFLKDFELTTVITGRHVSTDAIYLDRDTMCQSLIDFLRERFISEEGFVDVTRLFIQLQERANISEVHKVIGQDLDLSEMYYQYNELVNCVDVENYRRCGLLKLVEILFSKSDLFPEIALCFARILTATPSSSDVERANKCEQFN